jgi:hypothetical protein
LHQKILTQRLDALKIVSHKVHGILRNQATPTEIPDDQWELFCRYLDIHESTNYCLELDDKGFLFSTRNFAFRYYHSPGDGRVLIAMQR